MVDQTKYTGEANLNLTVLKDHKAIAKAAAERIAQRLREKPDLVIGLATGATMEPVYAELVRMQRERKDAQKAAVHEKSVKVVKADGEWSGDDFVKQSDALAGS
jgi:DNA-binding transcriptional regulator LsrR (DeoR family)